MDIKYLFYTKKLQSYALPNGLQDELHSPYPKAYLNIHRFSPKFPKLALLPSNFQQLTAATKKKSMLKKKYNIQKIFGLKK